MLAITLARENQTSNYQPQPNDDSHFEVKVVHEGLFPEIRVSLVSGSDIKKRLKTESEKIKS